MRSTLVLWIVASMLGIVADCPAAARQREGQKAAVVSELAGRFPDLGPEMRAYMGYIAAEEAELKHLFDVGEVPPGDYRLSRDRLVVTREAALRVARARDDDVVPDLYILVESELTQVLPTGIEAIRGKQPGSKIDDNWMYHGKIRRGEVFYILERTGGIGRDTSN
jgi:hypothetical protein